MINEHIAKKSGIPVKSLALRVLNYLPKLKYHKTLIEFTFFDSLEKVWEKGSIQHCRDCAATLCYAL